MFDRIKDSLRRKYRGVLTDTFGISPYSFTRYAGVKVLYTWFVRTLAIPGILSVFLVGNLASWGFSWHRDEKIDAIDHNRRRFYGRDDFDPDTNKQFDGMYTRSHGYVSFDRATGIKRTTEGRYTAPPPQELERRMNHIPITPEMLAKVKELHERSQQPVHESQLEATEYR